MRRDDVGERNQEVEVGLLESRFGGFPHDRQGTDIEVSQKDRRRQHGFQRTVLRPCAAHHQIAPVFGKGTLNHRPGRGNGAAGASLDAQTDQILAVSFQQQQPGGVRPEVLVHRRTDKLVQFARGLRPAQTAAEMKKDGKLLKRVL